MGSRVEVGHWASCVQWLRGSEQACRHWSSCTAGIITTVATRICSGVHFYFSGLGVHSSDSDGHVLWFH